MSIELSYQQEVNYLLVKMSGQWTEENMRQALEAIRDEATKRSQTRLLVDAREIPRPETEMTRAFSGEHWARILGPPFKSAVLVKPEVYNKFMESVAVSRGAIGRGFFEKEVALEWLLEPGESLPSAARARER